MEKSKAMAPMTKEEWEKRQSVVRKVLDEESGRYRLSYPSNILLLLLSKIYFILNMMKINKSLFIGFF